MPGDRFDLSPQDKDLIDEAELVNKLIDVATDEALTTEQVDELLGVIPCTGM